MTVDLYFEEGGIFLTPEQIAEFSYFNESDNTICTNMMINKYGMCELFPTSEKVNSYIYNLFLEKNDSWAKLYQTTVEPYDIINSTDMTIVKNETEVIDSDNTNSQTLGTSQYTDGASEDNVKENTFDSATLRQTTQNTTSANNTVTNSGTNTGTVNTDSERVRDNTETRTGREGQTAQDLILKEREVALYCFLDEIVKAVRELVTIQIYDFYAHDADETIF